MATSTIKRPEGYVETFTANPASVFSEFAVSGEYHSIDGTVRIAFIARASDAKQTTIIATDIPVKYRPTTSKNGVGFIRGANQTDLLTPTSLITVNALGQIGQGVTGSYTQAIGIISYQL